MDAQDGPHFRYLDLRMLDLEAGATTQDIVKAATEKVLDSRGCHRFMWQYLLGYFLG